MSDNSKVTEAETPQPEASPAPVDKADDAETVETPRKKRKVPPPGRRTPRQGRSQETVGKIIDAASALLAGGTDIRTLTTNRVAEAAGVSVGGLYRFFSDKQAIIDAIAVQRLDEFQTLLLDKVAETQPEGGAGYLNVVVDSFVAFLEDHPEFRQIAYGGSYISARVRQEQSDPAEGGSGFMKHFMVNALGMDPSHDLDLKLRIAAEVGDRLIAHAFDQPTDDARADVIRELKVLIAGYLFDERGMI